jgi:putative ABC transport system substrate-binding protein
VEGQNLVIQQRHAAGLAEKLPALASELVGLKPDVLVVYGVWALMGTGWRPPSTLPIVFTVDADPVGKGLVASLARPGGNITGLSDAHAELVPKRLELLKELVPTATRVGLLLNPDNPMAVSRAHHQGVDVRRRKRAAFSHMSFCMAGSPRVWRHAITVSAWSGKIVSGCG